MQSNSRNPKLSRVAIGYGRCIVSTTWISVLWNCPMTAVLPGKMEKYHHGPALYGIEDERWACCKTEVLRQAWFFIAYSHTRRAVARSLVKGDSLFKHQAH